MNIYTHQKRGIPAFADRPHGRSVAGILEKNIQYQHQQDGRSYVAQADQINRCASHGNGLIGENTGVRIVVVAPDEARQTFHND
jgi:hypothetical protein